MVREDLYDFMSAMERVLKENDFKGDWKDETFEYLYEKFKEEVAEVNHVAGLTAFDMCKKGFSETTSLEIKQQLEKELIDVANICMMIWTKL